MSQEITRAVLHEEGKKPWVHRVDPPWPLPPSDTITISRCQLVGIQVHRERVVFFLTHTDAEGIPHYKRRT